ncbi:hypothetical protein WN55_11190 [Dufourea novaeangliae]|uniref:Chitin-binding type-2 domain-containing protein n=1 Tax=Dufourea novaeangliae TaxID=178035 RepID=A0A154PCD5_DUFNO|nr:hypothetical protein WN55_11190 [Dufourea novaeangliae]
METVKVLGVVEGFGIWGCIRLLGCPVDVDVGAVTLGEQEGVRDTGGGGGDQGGGKVSKRAKPVDPDEDVHENNEDYYYEDVDERNNPTNEAPAVPPGFLSPSAKYPTFYCDEQPYPGFFADVETRCQAWHYCDIDGRQATFLCPNGTQFSQAVFVCDWWFNVRCELSPKLYAINSRLYGRPTESPTRPHRLITKELLENIFVRRK